jgi:hypothetical protein
LVAICLFDAIFGFANLLSFRKAIIPSIGWAILTILLQLGDIATAPQYKMTMIYFAGYLFGLWAFDAILLAQVAVVYLGFSTRRDTKALARQKQYNYFEMRIRNSKRDFLRIAAVIGGFVVLAAGLGAWSTLSSSPPRLPALKRQTYL